MRVKCVRSFAGNGVSHGMGDEFELPDGVDWLQAGLVVPVRPVVERAVSVQAEEVADLTPPKTTLKGMGKNPTLPSPKGEGKRGGK